MGHLVISRRKDESFTIGDNIRVQVAHIGGKHVRLLIEAPTDLVISRSDQTPVVCAWCMAIIRKGDTRRPASHGMCEKCSDEQMARAGEMCELKSKHQLGDWNKENQ